MRFKSNNTAVDQVQPPVSPDKGAGRLFSAAVVLARKSRYTEASKLLQEALDAGGCAGAEAFDLQARIYAQQGLYLHAEECWRKAKHLDGSNPIYDDALSRLWRDRRSIGWSIQVMVGVTALAILGLLFWQTAFVNPGIRNRQDTTEASLASIGENVSAFQNISRSWVDGITASVSKLRDDLRNLEGRLSERLNALPTITRATEDRNAVVTHVDEQVTLLGEATSQKLNELGMKLVAVDSELTKRIDGIDAKFTQMSNTLDIVEDGFGKHINTIESSLQRRMDEVASTIRHDMKPLATEADIAMVNCLLSELEDRLEGVEAEIQSLREPLGENPSEQSEQLPVSQPNG